MPSRSKKKKIEYRSKWKRVWNFIWKEDSPLSWIINIILAFVIVKFLIFPGLGFILNTSHPVVAVVSCSMEHRDPFIKGPCSFNHVNLDEWWPYNNQWLVDNGFTKEEFKSWRFSNGFNKGDIIVLKGVDIENIKNGDAIVFIGESGIPIIHRVVKTFQEDNTRFIQTKGDNNPLQRSDEKKISSDQIIGKAVFRIPFLGWVKIIFTNLFK